MRKRMLSSLLVAALSMATSCRDAAPTAANPGGGDETAGGDSPRTVGGGTITFLSRAPGAPPLQGSTVSFHAVQGKDRDAEIWYVTAGDADRLLRLRIRKHAQIVAPDGHALADGDSILITIAVSDTSRLIVNFQPAGIRFVGSEAADLTLWYRHTHPDLNRDGVVNALDASLESTLAIFRQESPTALWERLSGVLNTSNDEVEARIGGFTNYVIAY